MASRIEKKTAVEHETQGPTEQEDKIHPEPLQKLFGNFVHIGQTLWQDARLIPYLESMEIVPRLKQEVQDLKETTRAQDVAVRQNLDRYNADRDLFKQEEARIRQEHEEAKNANRKKDELIKNLKSENSKMTAQIKSLDDATAKTRQRVAEAEKITGELRKELTTEKKRYGTMTDQLRQCKSEVTDLKQKLERTTQDCLSKERQVKQRDNYIEQTAKLTVPLSDDPLLLKAFDGIWADTWALVCSTFLRDTPQSDPNRQTSFWTRIQSSNPWAQQIPLPQTNSSDAKRMRCVVIASFTARIFAEYLFLPTPILRAGSDMRDLLTRQARENSERAAALRALLQAILPDENVAMSRLRVNDACDQVACLIEGLIPVDADTEFRAKLSTLASEAHSTWKSICRQTDCYEVRFDDDHYDDWTWRTIVLEGDSLKMLSPESHSEDQHDHTGLVVFPRLYVISDKFEYPETRGAFLAKTQTRQAQAELLQIQASNNMQRRGSMHARVSRNRASSATVEVSKKIQPFLEEPGQNGSDPRSDREHQSRKP